MIDAYVGAKSAHRKRDWDAAAVRAGRFSEVVARYLQERTAGEFTPFGVRLPDFVTLMRGLEKLPRTALPDGLRVLVPRALTFAYTVRNNRGSGHVAGDVDANAIDSGTVMRVLDWVLAELISETTTMPVEEVQALVDVLAQRELPAIWVGAGKKRVLDPNLTRSEQVLLLLYSEPDFAVPLEDVFAWVEAPRLPQFVERIIDPLHERRMLEFDRDSRTVILLPPGEAAAEKILANLP
jgi:hypothetical protein